MQIRKYFYICLLTLLCGFTVSGSKPVFAQTPANLISNPSVESASNPSNIPLDWYQGKFGTNQTVFTYPVTGYNGEKAVKVELITRSSGDAKWYFKDVVVTGGAKYSYYEYYLSSITSTLTIRYTLTTGGYSYLQLARLNPTSNWTKIEYTFQAPANAKSLTVFHLIAAKGVLTTDNFSLSQIGFPTPTITPTPTPFPTGTATTTPYPTLTPTNSPSVTPTPLPTQTVTPTTAPEPSPTPTLIPTPSATSSPYPTPTPTLPPVPTPTQPVYPNLILNPSLEESNGRLPMNWLNGRWGTNTTSFAYPVTGISGDKAARVDVSSYQSGDAKWFFDDVAVTPETKYIFSDYYQANVSSNLVIRYKLLSGQYTYQSLTQVGSSADWHKLNVPFTTPSGVVALTVFHLLGQNGSLSIDNYSLTQAPDPIPFSQGMVSLTFDDGFLTTYQNALPILNSAGYKSTQYIITGSTGTDPACVTAGQILSMQAQGHEIGAHSRTHPHLTQLTLSQLQSEIEGSRQDLVALGVTSVSSFAYPYGEYDNLVIDVVQSGGYTGARLAFSPTLILNYQNSDPYLLDAQSVEQNTSIDLVKSWIDVARTNKLWLILTFHSIQNGGNRYSVTPANLQTIVNYLTQQNISVVTVSEGLSLMAH